MRCTLLLYLYVDCCFEEAGCGFMWVSGKQVDYSACAVY